MLKLNRKQFHELKKQLEAKRINRMAKDFENKIIEPIAEYRNSYGVTLLEIVKVKDNKEDSKMYFVSF